ncbi:hypothetical protein E2562_029847 [Oryza meyeriana var. granulata]|uniref:BHLH domain-containing protein n=1 Tax=Oryza meyeriana var. granulata TaxID=110450 RepID=A0A6G1ER11_9ORYZ|nr:hypothetical protein E2562_029847 [Oryza meyeriana var. granulata]
MADEWWSSSARTDDEAACSTAPDADESSAARSAPISFCQPGLPYAAAASSSSSSFLLADQHMDYWTQEFIRGGGRASATEAAAAAASFSTLLQLQGQAASHRLLLDDQAPPQGVSPPYEADSMLQRYCSSGTPPAPQQSFPGRVSPGLFRQPETEPPQFLLQPRFLKSNADVCSPATRRSATDHSPESTAKKARIETLSPLPTFKVRKEKLGDRITALQQLVSPFGKTDTASVLHETIEYIKFLHDQVASLSSPYLRCGRPMPLQHQQGSHKAKDDDEAKQDLRSRGLCLVPVASTYTGASETGTEFWHPTFGGTFR